MAFEDSHLLGVQFLTALHTPIPVTSRVPANRPAEFIVARRLPAPEVPPVRDTYRLDVQHWAATEPRAMELANATRTALRALAGNDDLGVMVYQVNVFKGAAPVDDPETGTPIGWLTYDLIVRADDVIHFVPGTSS